MNGSCFSLNSLVYKWVGVWELQPHVRTQNEGKLPPPPPVYKSRFIDLSLAGSELTLIRS